MLACPQHCTLRFLGLRSAGVADAGVQALACALTTAAQTSVLWELDLQRNGIGAVGVRALAGMLAKNTTLRVLRLHPATTWAKLTLAAVLPARDKLRVIV
jgi:Ran GTPase-activating protein (RanGAP) involved in mRNA processing and transport